MPNGMLSNGSTGLVEGRAYKVIAVGITIYGHPGVNVGAGPHTGPNRGMSRASRFRRVHRLDLSAWLAQSVGNTDKLDKKKVRVK